MIFTILSSMFWLALQQAALSFLVRMAEYADRLVVFSCCGAAIALALGAVRLGAVPLLGAALGSWGARRARRKAQGWKGWEMTGDDGRCMTSEVAMKFVGVVFWVTFWVLWMSRLSEWASVASCTSQAKAMGMKFSTSAVRGMWLQCLLTDIYLQTSGIDQWQNSLHQKFLHLFWGTVVLSRTGR